MSDDTESSARSSTVQNTRLINGYVSVQIRASTLKEVQELAQTIKKRQPKSYFEAACTLAEFVLDLKDLSTDAEAERIQQQGSNVQEKG